MNDGEPLRTANPWPLLLTPEEAAKALRIGRTRLYALLADGTLPSIQIGHSRRVAMKDLEDFVRRLQDSVRSPESARLQNDSGLRHDGRQRPSHRSRRRKPISTPGAELLPLPFPDLPEGS